jgi:large subunit ribosomal protein L23
MKFKTTEKSVRLIESENTLVIEFPLGEKKPSIKKQVEEMFNVKVAKIRIHSKANRKIAYIRLKKENPAIDVATKVGII